MDATRSCEFNQLASLQIGAGFAHVGGELLGIRVVFLCQVMHNRAQCSSIAAGKNFVGGFVQFDDAFREKEYAFAGREVGL
jgi:hypothetical protein